jgi:hypothetical protein
VFYTPEELYSLNRQMPMGAPNTASNETWMEQGGHGKRHQLQDGRS